MESLKDIILACKKQDAVGQKRLYMKYRAVLFAICKRYVKNTEDAEDVFIEAFYKIYSKIDSYTGVGNFEGWMKRIMVNESLMFLRKKHNFKLSVEQDNIDVAYEAQIISNINYEELLKVLDELPTGYRTIFNMYVIEGYKHREIAEILNISINTSKSQLISAKNKLKSMLKKKHIKRG